MTSLTLPPKIYIPWVRQGTARLITQVDPLEDNLPARATINATFKLNGEDVSNNVELYGPGDVNGFDRGQVIRVEPPDGTRNFHPGHFPLVEFSRPDLPWLFTPAHADDQGRLRPWLCLIVVEMRDGIEMVTSTDRPLPIIENVPVADLPPLEEIWAWAHAQAMLWPGLVDGIPPVDGGKPTQDALMRYLSEYPQYVLSRLVCPIVLKPSTPYYACLVPTFQLGVQAGLGQTIDDASGPTLLPAWGTTGTVSLPVYYWWTFTTGEPDTAFNKFRNLFERLSLSKEMPSTVGVRTVDVGTPGYSMPSEPGTLRLLGSAFRARHCDPQSLPFDGPLPYREALRNLLNASVPAGTPGLLPGIPVLTPPIYGRAYTGQQQLDPNAESGWAVDLNLDPVYRLAAALGTEVIQRQQDELVASAWAQVGELRQAQQRLRQAQLARSAGISIVQTDLQPLKPDKFLVVSSPVHA